MRQVYKYNSWKYTSLCKHSHSNKKNYVTQSGLQMKKFCYISASQSGENGLESSALEALT